MIRLSDYIVRYLRDEGVNNVFMLAGGGAMYIVDSVGRNGMEYVCCHHEQACSIAAQAYAMYKNSLGVCVVTTGPGGTNALTGTAAAYVDSTPVLYISGQVKTPDFASLRGVRQYGAQENDIIPMVKPITKYAVTILEPDEVKYHLQKAVYLATHGRQGPVWLDVPLDIQAAMIDETALRGFDPESEEPGEPDYTILPECAERKEKVAGTARLAREMLKAAKRPLFLCGHGVAASGARERFRALQAKLGVPMMSTWRALEIMDTDNPFFFGSPGLQAPRYSNLILQGADLLIILGTRLDNMITAFNEPHFGFRAKKIVVDIDERELNKLKLTEATFLSCDVSEFIDAMLTACEGMPAPDIGRWLDFCRSLKARFPLLAEKQAKELGGADLYRAAHTISKYCGPDDALVFSSTSRCNTAGHIAFKRRAGQRSVSSMGQGSMGFALPSGVGAYFASGKKRTVILEGDGSLQLNIQELQTVKHYGINAKMFIYGNRGYAAIKTMQDRNFDGLHVGSTEESGLSMPDLGRIAAAYGIPYYRIDDDNMLESTVKAVMAEKGAVICEICGALDFDEIPKCISSVDECGKRVSAALENPFPFLPEEELTVIYEQL